MEKELKDYPYWIAISVEGKGRVGSYFSKTAPPCIGEKINLTYFSHIADRPLELVSDALYVVIDIIHNPRDFDNPAYWEAALSDIDYVNVTVRPV